MKYISTILVIAKQCYRKMPLSCHKNESNEITGESSICTLPVKCLNQIGIELIEILEN